MKRECKIYFQLYVSGVKSKEVNPRCHGEIRRWQHGSYTLVHDTDSEGFEFALDCMLFCSCKGEYPLEMDKQ